MKGQVVFGLRKAGLGLHTSVPPGVVFLHPSTVLLFRGFFVEGDLVSINGSGPLEIVLSDLAYPPVFEIGERVVVGDDPSDVERLLERGRVVYAGGLLIKGDTFLPPILPLDERGFRELVVTFKREDPDPRLLASHGIPPQERYLREVGPFFGFHVPNAVQLLEESGWRELFREWGGAEPSYPPHVEISLIRHPTVNVVDTGISGYYPIKTPYPIYICENGCVGPFEVCPLCGSPTKRVKVCPLCGNYYSFEEERCPRDGSPLLEETVHDPRVFLERYQGLYGSVGEVSVGDGEPEHPLRIYYRKKTNLTVGKRGVVEMEAPIYPGSRNLLPKKLVDVFLRVYRFISLFKGERDMPRNWKEIVGRKAVLLADNVGYVVDIEGIGDVRFELRKELFYSLPSKDVRIAVYEDVVENGRNVSLKVLEPGRGFPYLSYPTSSLFDADIRVESVIERYVRVARDLGADTRLAIPLLFPLLKEREVRARRTPLYRCSGCGAEYNRRTLSGLCPRCGGKLELIVGVERVDLEDLIERYSSLDELREYLTIFQRRLGGRSSQKNLLDMF